MKPRKAAAWKQEALARLEEHLVKYNVISVSDLQKVRSSQLQEIRKKLRGRAQFLVTKNTLLRKAAEGVGSKKPNLSEFGENLVGSNLLIFSDMDPFALTLFLERNKVRVAAKAGDTATNDIMIPGGNTGLQPGPVISEFGQVKVPTRIEAGSIYVVKDTVVAKKGDLIEAKLASLLSKLGMKPMEAGLRIKYAYDNGLILKGDELQIDLDQVQADLTTAATNAFGLAVEAAYMLPETAPQILGRALRQALALSVEAEYFDEGTSDKIIQRAHRQALALASSIARVNEEAAPPEISV